MFYIFCISTLNVFNHKKPIQLTQRYSIYIILKQQLKVSVSCFNEQFLVFPKDNCTLLHFTEHYVCSERTETSYVANLPVDHHVQKPQSIQKTFLLHQLLHTLLLVKALSPPTQPPPVPAYLLEPMVALKVITSYSVATLLLLIMPLLHQQHGCWISREQLNAEQ